MVLAQEIIERLEALRLALTEITPCWALQQAFERLEELEAALVPEAN